MLGMKHRCRVVEVVVRPGADGGCPSDGRWNESLLVETKFRLPKRKA